MYKRISERQFSIAIKKVLTFACDEFGCVTGPGRSGAIASVYASHILRIPFIPYGQKPPIELGRLLIIDTAVETGKTIRKACKKYAKYNPFAVAIYAEPPRVIFWYEAQKPQSYKHENRSPE